MAGSIYKGDVLWRSFRYPGKYIKYHRTTEKAVVLQVSRTSFDLNQVLLETEYGMLTIKGHDLHVGKLSVDKGELEVDGKIDSYVYSEVMSAAKKGESFLNRLFK